MCPAPSSGPAAPPPGDPLAPLRSESWLTEARRKAIHLYTIILPLDLLFEWLPWPRGRGAWRVLLVTLVVAAIALDVVRVHDRRVRAWFRDFFGGMIREHEQHSLLGSTYLLMAALLAVEIFPRPVAAAALGFTILGDAFAAMVGKAYGRIRIFDKSLEGTLGGLAVSLMWAWFLAGAGHVPWHVAVVGALVASLVELLPIPLDDNLAIPLVAGYAMRWMWMPS